MIDPKDLKKITRQVIETQKDLEMFKSLSKKSNGRLTAVGRAVISEGLAQGIAPAAIARLLDITRAAVAHYE